MGIPGLFKFLKDKKVGVEVEAEEVSQLVKGKEVLVDVSASHYMKLRRLSKIQIPSVLVEYLSKYFESFYCKRLGLDLSGITFYFDGFSTTSKFETQKKRRQKELLKNMVYV